VSQPEQVQSLIAQTVERFGRLDCAFNNAAVLSKLARTGDFREVDFDTEVRLNLKSVWLRKKYELEQMQKQKPCGGAIVNTSSVNGLGRARYAALYSMSKAGILALTRSAAQEYAADNIRGISLVAGGFDTEMLQSAISQVVGWRQGEGRGNSQGIGCAGSRRKDWQARGCSPGCSVAVQRRLLLCHRPISDCRWRTYFLGAIDVIPANIRLGLLSAKICFIPGQIML
jgi:NAD(P)-dependent dehydrogenase (short-subunit alcohol dehydrogenase family)